MTQYLYIALWIICFYDAIVMLLLPSSVQFILGTDGSAARFIVDLMALAIGVYVLINYGFKRLDNRWFGLFLIAMVVSHFHSPNINFESTFIPKDMAIYNYKPMFEVMVFFLMFMGIKSIELTPTIVQKIFKSICWIPVVYSGYIIFQSIGMDQFYRVVGDPTHMSRHPESGGFISQPVFAAAFLAMCLPFLIRNKSLWMIILVIVGIVATGNRSGLIAVAISTLIMFPKTFKFGCMALVGYLMFLLSSIVIHIFYPNINFHDTGRLDVWIGLFKDFFLPAFPGISSDHILTGHGIGSFPVLFPFFHKTGFYQAHNEIFELIYALGISGIVIGFFMLKDIIFKLANGTIIVSLITIFICAMTNAVWHIPQIAFMTVFLLGLAYNETIGVAHVETR